MLLDNARIKGSWGEESFESIGVFHNLFTSSQADCSCAFQKCMCAVRLMPSYRNEELKKSGYSSEVTTVFGQGVLNSGLLEMVVCTDEGFSRSTSTSCVLSCSDNMSKCSKT